MKGQHLLTIQAPKELQEIESEFKAKMQSHSEIIENIVRENIQLKTKMAQLEATMKEFEAIGKFITADPNRLQRFTALLDE